MAEPLPTYPDTPDVSRILGALPFEWNTAFRGHGLDQLFHRLRVERGQWESGLLGDPSGPLVAILVLVADRLDAPLLEPALRTWLAQSIPGTGVQLCLPGGPDAVEAWLQSAGLSATVSAWHGADDLATAHPDAFVLFATPGDFLHPSLVASLCRLSMAETPPAVVVWNSVSRVPRGDANEMRYLRRPALQPLTLRHVNYPGGAFAVRGHMLAGLSVDPAQEFPATRGHLLLLEVLQTRPDACWDVLSEFLQIHWEDADPCRHPAANPAFFARYDALLPGAQMIGQPRQPYVVAPRRNVRSISVLIPYRDRPDLTVACLEAVAAQDLNGATLEIILIDNQSGADTVRALDDAVDRLGLRANVRSVSYAKAFNHSLQINLGAEASSGEVLVLLNNDCILDSPCTLFDCALWALEDRVGVVGPRQMSTTGALTSAGVVPVFVGHDFGAVVQDVTCDPVFAETVHETPCISFACAAVARHRFDDLGRLDPVDFPVAYNDIDFCLRALAAGLRNIHLGHLVVRHDQFSTRPRTDETPQRLILRKRHPHLWTLKETTLELDVQRAATVASIARSQGL